MPVRIACVALGMQWLHKMFFRLLVLRDFRKIHNKDSLCGRCKKYNKKNKFVNIICIQKCD